MVSIFLGQRMLADPIVYALLDPLTKEVRYIGKSMRGLERARSHFRPSVLSQPKRTHLLNWLRKLQKQNFVPEVVILEHCHDDEQLSERERWWIAFARGWGCRLTNVTDGGEGKSGFVYSDDLKNKMWRVQTDPQIQRRRSSAVKETLGSLAVVEKLCAAQNTPKAKARQKSVGAAVFQRPDVRAKQRATLFDPVVREKINQSQRDFHVNEQRRATLAQTNALPEIKEKRSSAMKEVFRRPAVRKKHQEHTQSAMRRPEVRKQHLAGVRAYWERERQKRGIAGPRMRINLLVAEAT